MAQPDIVTQDQAPQTVMIPGLYRRTMATGQHMMVVEVLRANDALFAKFSGYEVPIHN